MTMNAVVSVQLSLIYYNDNNDQMKRCFIYLSFKSYILNCDKQDNPHNVTALASIFLLNCSLGCIF